MEGSLREPEQTEQSRQQQDVPELKVAHTSHSIHSNAVTETETFSMGAHKSRLARASAVCVRNVGPLWHTGMLQDNSCSCACISQIAVQDTSLSIFLPRVAFLGSTCPLWRSKSVMRAV